MPWLREIDRAVIEEFISHSSAPMLASLPTGEILWSNKAFQELVRYNSHQLNKSENENAKHWDQISLPGDDLDEDIEQAKKLVDGEVLEYYTRKSYVQNGGVAIPCELYLRRYPQFGEFQCVLVTVTPIVNGNKFLLAEFQKHQDTSNLVLRETQITVKELIRIIKEEKEKEKPTHVQTFFQALGGLAQDNPKISVAIVTAVAVAILGERLYGLGIKFTGE